MQKSEGESHSVVSNSLQPHGLSPWNSPGQNTGVGSLSLLQGIFPTQELNPGLLHCRWILLPAEPHKGNPKILEWVAYPFSSGSSWPRNWARVSCCRWIFTNWAISFGAQTPMCEHIFQHLSPSLSHWEQGSARAPEKRPSPARLEGWGSPAYVARLGNSSSLAAALGFSLSPGVSNSQNSASCPSFHLSSLLLR